MTLVLRDYQRDATDIAVAALLAGGNPLTEIPTGGGKSPVIAATAAELFAHDGGRIHVYAHTRELVSQNFKTFLRMYPQLSRYSGIVCAGLGRRDLHCKLIFATPASMIRQHVSPPARLLIDEAHRIGMMRISTYKELIDRYGVPVGGLTATPYRLGEAFTEGNLFGKPSYRITMGELLEQGYLVPPQGREARFQFDTSKVQLQAGDYNKSQLDRIVNTPEFNGRVAQEVRRVWSEQGSKKCLFFAANVSHGNGMEAALAAEGFRVAAIYGDDDTLERDATLAAFTAGRYDVLVNVGVLTTGYDETAIDLVVLARPTASVTLYVQMAGRGSRLHPGKRFFTLLDFGGNIRRHGPVDAPRDPGKKGEGVAPLKVCPSCECLILASQMVCRTLYQGEAGSGCGHVFPPTEKPEPLAVTEASFIAALFSEQRSHRWVNVLDRPAWVKKTFAKSGNAGFQVSIPTNEGTITQYIITQSYRGPLSDTTRRNNSAKWKYLVPGAAPPNNENFQRLHEVAAAFPYPAKLLISRDEKGFFSLHDCATQ